MSKHGEMVLVHLDPVTLARYRRISDDTGRKIEELIQCAASEAALEYAKAHGMLVPVPDDPHAHCGPDLGGIR